MDNARLDPRTKAVIPITGLVTCRSRPEEDPLAFDIVASEDIDARFAEPRSLTSDNEFYMKKPKSFDVTLITGASGSGKTACALQLAKVYQDEFPERPVVLISGKTEDSSITEALKKHNLRITQLHVTTPCEMSWPRVVRFVEERIGWQGEEGVDPASVKLPRHVKMGKKWQAGFDTSLLENEEGGGGGKDDGGGDDGGDEIHSIADCQMCMRILDRAHRHEERVRRANMRRGKKRGGRRGGGGGRRSVFDNLSSSDDDESDEDESVDNAMMASALARGGGDEESDLWYKKQNKEGSRIARMVCASEANFGDYVQAALDRGRETKRSQEAMQVEEQKAYLAGLNAELKRMFEELVQDVVAATYPHETSSMSTEEIGALVRTMQNMAAGRPFDTEVAEELERRPNLHHNIQLAAADWSEIENQARSSMWRYNLDSGGRLLTKKYDPNLKRAGQEEEETRAREQEEREKKSKEARAAARKKAFGDKKRGALFLFDDAEFGSKDMRRGLNMLMEDSATKGREPGQNVVVVKHKLMQRELVLLRQEATNIIYFPTWGRCHDVRKLLKTDGYSRDVISRCTQFDPSNKPARAILDTSAGLALILPQHYFPLNTQEEEAAETEQQNGTEPNLGPSDAGRRKNLLF